VNLEDKLAVDLSIYGQEIIRQVVLRTLKDRLWGAWKVLCGDAGIILVRIDPKEVLTPPKPKREE
jgi:hypothetical protein